MAEADTALAKARQVFSKHGGMSSNLEGDAPWDPPENPVRDAGAIEQVGRTLQALHRTTALKS